MACLLNAPRQGLTDVPGFKEFKLLRGPEAEDHTLYASHTIWASKADFEAWKREIETLDACRFVRKQGSIIPLRSVSQ